MSKFKHGVASGKLVQEIFEDAKINKYALPAVNVTSSSTVNAVLETAAELNSPVIIQFSNGGCHFFSGKGLSNKNHKATLGRALFKRFQDHQDHLILRPQCIKRSKQAGP